MAQGAAAHFARFLISAKILFADEEHSDAEAIAGDILVVALAGANLFAILIRIAGERHSGAVEPAVGDQILGQAPLHLVYDLTEGKEMIVPLLDVELGHAAGPPQGFFEGDLFGHVTAPRSGGLRPSVGYAGTRLRATAVGVSGLALLDSSQGENLEYAGTPKEQRILGGIVFARGLHQ